MSRSREELRREAEAVKGTAREIEGLVRVPSSIKENAEVVFSLRFTRSEMAVLRQAAAANGVRLSALVREAALQAANEGGGAPSSRDVALREARQFVQAAAEALERA